MAEYRLPNIRVTGADYRKLIDLAEQAGVGFDVLATIFIHDGIQRMRGAAVAEATP